MAQTNRPRSASEVLSTFNLQARLTSAMSKAGLVPTVTLETCGISQDFYDVSGIRVVAPNPAMEGRAVTWLQAALRKAGVKQWHTGAWQGPCEMGDPEVIRTKSYGEQVTLVALVTTSIGN